MKRIEKVVQVILLLTLIYYSHFYKLDSLSYRIWDEARLATSAYEMNKTSNFIVTTVNYEPDMWSTKPPMMIWAQALCIRLHGINEFSIRFPAAICATLTIFLIFWFVFSLAKNGWVSLLAATVLCTANGYITNHGTRMGEYDSMLALFTTSYLLAFFLYIEEKELERKNKFLLLFFLALMFAALTKGIAGILFSPILFLYILFKKQLIVTLRNKYFYIGLISFLFVVLGYYFLREHYNHGYLKAVYENELGGRFLSENEGHTGPFDFYYQNLKCKRFGNWFWLLPIGLVIAIMQTTQTRVKAVVYSFLCAILFLLILSFSKTKLWWYDIPAYPLFAIIIGLTALQLGNLIRHFLPFIKKEIIIITVCVFASAQPVFEMFQMIRYSTDDLSEDSFYDISYYLRDAAYNNKNLNGVVYVSADYGLQWTLYVSQLNEKGISLIHENFSDISQFHKGQKVLAHQQKTKDHNKSKYQNTKKKPFTGFKI